MRKIKITNIITYIVALLLVAGIVSAAVYYYDDVESMFDDNYSTFSVSMGDNLFLSEQSDITFPFDTELRFSVAYDWPRFASIKNNSYSVKVVPCVENDFDFTVDGNIFSFAAEEDITSAFNVVQYADYFTMTVPSSIVTVLKSIYPVGEIVVPDLDVKKDYYTLIVTASDGKELIKLSFKYFSIVEGVELSVSALEF